MRFTPTSRASLESLQKRTRSSARKAREAIAERPSRLNYRDNCHAHSAARFRAGSRRFRCVRYFAVVFLEESGSDSRERLAADPLRRNIICSPPKLDE